MLTPIEHKDQRILLTDQVADICGTVSNNINTNYTRNKDKFKEGLHYFLLTGDDLKEFKNQCTDSTLVSKNAGSLMLWTDRGVARHCKILDTEEAWEQFDKLEEYYFNKDYQPQTQTQSSAIIEDEVERNLVAAVKFTMVLALPTVVMLL